MCWYRTEVIASRIAEMQLGQSASVQYHTQAQTCLSDTHVTPGLTWQTQTRRNRQILPLLLRNGNSPARAVTIQQGYAACQICICKPACVYVCV